jgi:hypothetical protein
MLVELSSVAAPASTTALDPPSFDERWAAWRQRVLLTNAPCDGRWHSLCPF